MDMEERYRLIISTILNAIGLNVEVEHMMATGRIDMTVKTSRYIYVIELKLLLLNKLSIVNIWNLARPMSARL